MAFTATKLKRPKEVFGPQVGPQTAATECMAYELLYGGAKFTGKGQTLDSLISTPFGLMEMGNLQVGSIITSPTSTQTEVIAIHPLGVKDIYDFKFSDETIDRCTLEHLWKIKFENGDWFVTDTEKIIIFLKNDLKVFIQKYNEVKKECDKIVEIESISFSGREKAQCITVNNRDGLYVTGNFNVTHNSFWLLLDYLQDVDEFGEEWNGIIFRRSIPQLNDLKKKARKIFPKLGAIWNESKGFWLFPSGSRLYMKYLAKEEDVEQYWGHEYPWIGIDEIGNWPTYEMYEIIRTCCRTSDPEVAKRKRVRCTGNPGGPGHFWVKAYFVDPAPPYTIMTDDLGRTRVFIQAKMTDNQIGMANDPTYAHELLSIKDPIKRKAFLDGDWDIVPGGFFTNDWSEKNIIPSFPPLTTWKIVRSMDWGSSHPFSVGWWAIADGSMAPDGVCYPSGSVIRLAEWYGCEKDKNGVSIPDKGIRMHIEEVTKGILYREKNWNVSYGVSDWNIFVEDGGYSLYSRMIKEGKGKVRFRKADKKRKPGWDLMRQYMTGKNGVPDLYVMDNCRDFIRTIPALQHDKRDLDDIDTKSEDHIADEARYFLNSRAKDRRYQAPSQNIHRKRYDDYKNHYKRVLGYGK